VRRGALWLQLEGTQQAGHDLIFKGERIAGGDGESVTVHLPVCARIHQAVADPYQVPRFPQTPGEHEVDAELLSGLLYRIHLLAAEFTGRNHLHAFVRTASQARADGLSKTGRERLLAGIAFGRGERQNRELLWLDPHHRIRPLAQFSRSATQYKQADQD
jgi:hypothetical protein